MWRSKAGLIFRKVSSALNTSSTSIRWTTTHKLQITVPTRQSQVFSSIPICFYSSAPLYVEIVEYPNENGASDIQNQHPHRCEQPQAEKSETLENSGNSDLLKKFKEDAEKVVSLLKEEFEVEELEKELETLELDINGKMIAEVVKTPGLETEQFVRFFRWAVKQCGYVPNKRVMDSITMALCNKGERKAVEMVKSLIEEVAENHRGIVTRGALDTLIENLVRLGRVTMALEVFQQFERFECKPQLSSYFVTIRGLCDACMFDEAISVIREMENSGHFPGDKGSVARMIIRLFCKFKRPQYANQVYLMALEKKKFPGLVAVNDLVDSFCKVEEDPKFAAGILMQMPMEYRKDALKTYFTLVRTQCNCQDLEGAKLTLSDMVRHGPRPDHAAYNALITAFCKAENPEEALGFLEQMPGRRLKPDIYAYTVILASYARAGSMQEACDVFSKAKEAHRKLPLIMYKTLIDGFCRSGDPKMAYNYFSDLKESGLTPNRDIYSRLARAYVIQGLDWHTANELLHEMEEKGHSPSLYTRSLVSAMKELIEEASQAEANKIKI